jgi:hypothetical protein
MSCGGIVLDLVYLALVGLLIGAITVFGKALTKL